jgi:hypothetical protein
LGAALAAALIAVSAWALAPQPGSAATAPQEGEHDTLVNTDPIDNTPAVLDGNTQAVVDLGARVIVGGRFTQVKRWDQGTVYSRTNIFAYDKATGAIDTTFVPQLDGQVTALLKAADGNIYVSGQFRNVNGVAGGFLVKLDPVTGAKVASFNAAPNGMVYDLHLKDGTLYAGGTFSKMRQVVRTNFAMLNATTGQSLGADLPFTAAATGTTRVMRLDVTPDGTTLVALGNFTNVGGQTRQNIAKLDVDGTNATVSSWFTDLYRYGLCSSGYDTYVRDVDFSPDGSFFGVVTTGAYGTPPRLCDSSARWETASTGTVTPTWVDYTGGDSLSSVAITGAAMYVAGHNRWSNNAVPPRGDVPGPGSVDRLGIIALDVESGVPLAWNPTRERGLTAWRMTPTADGLFVMSDSDHMSGEFHPKFSFLPVAGGLAPSKAVAQTLPTELTYAGSSASGSPASGQLYHRGYDGAALGSESAMTDTSNWSQVRGVVIGSDRTYRFNGDGTVQVTTDGTTWNPSPNWLNLSNLRGAAFGPLPTGRGRLFYRINNDRNLYGRGFSLDSGLISSLGSTVSGPSVDGTDWTGTNGLAVIAGKLYHTHSDGTLRRTDLVNGAPVMNTTVTISGPAVDGLDWSNTTGLHSRTEAAPPPPPPPPPTNVYENHFTDLTGWTTMSGFTLDTSNGAPTGAAPSALADVNGARVFARQALGASYDSLCSAVSLRLNRQTTSTILMRLRTADNQAGGRLFVAANGRLHLRSDVAGVQTDSGVTLPIGTWTRLELCATAGTSGTLLLKVEGTQVASWTGAMGTAGFGMVEIGEAVTNNWSANYDDLLVTEDGEDYTPPPPPPPPPPVVIVYENHFADLNGWTTLSGLTLDTANGAPAGAAPSALADVSGTRAYARQALGSSYNAICSAVSIRLNRQTTSTVLMRLRTADNQAGGRVFIAANGAISIRSDVSGVQTATGVRLLVGTWTTLKLCATAGASGTLSLAVDGTQVATYTGAMGTAGFGMVEIGETVNNDWSANLDDLVVTDPTATP